MQHLFVIKSDISALALWILFDDELYCWTGREINPLFSNLLRALLHAEIWGLPFGLFKLKSSQTFLLIAFLLKCNFSAIQVLTWFILFTRVVKTLFCKIPLNIKISLLTNIDKNWQKYQN